MVTTEKINERSATRWLEAALLRCFDEFGKIFRSQVESNRTSDVSDRLKCSQCLLAGMESFKTASDLETLVRERSALSDPYCQSMCL